MEFAVTDEAKQKLLDDSNTLINEKWEREVLLADTISGGHERALSTTSSRTRAALGRLHDSLADLKNVDEEISISAGTRTADDPTSTSVVLSQAAANIRGSPPVLEPEKVSRFGAFVVPGTEDSVWNAVQVCEGPFDF